MRSPMVGLRRIVEAVAWAVIAVMAFILPATVHSFRVYVLASVCAFAASAALGFAAASLRTRRERVPVAAEAEWRSLAR